MVARAADLIALGYFKDAVELVGGKRLADSTDWVGKIIVCLDRVIRKVYRQDHERGITWYKWIDDYDWKGFTYADSDGWTEFGPMHTDKLAVSVIGGWEIDESQAPIIIEALRRASK